MFKRNTPTTTNTPISVTTEIVVIPTLPESALAMISSDDWPRIDAPLVDQLTEKRFWPLYFADGEPSTPDFLYDEILSGRARLVDIEKAERDMEYFLRIAAERRIHHEADSYWKPIAAAHKRSALDARIRFNELYPDGPVVPAVEKMMSAREVAEVLGISVQTVSRQSGQTLPAPVKIGGQYRWRAAAIQRVIERAGK